ncbi:mitochondrial 54S ribosomal protein bL27m [Aspergillus homomorphus CBS 101889]|uniref:Large ribosomal subunit protein bL27m n=1 Tax=Aspergillus homomorphus (strain CBS 101889) TaxID=1450537 RepID=A0A395HH63_ASPHC|nr:hypothetical protein BO97DRAFT_409306 [Aspergillus homomorphus CBS 101889]RAL06986.1 hypothetical protein BO97DRAFT_409306 [Aspergillus homomorphus CBS 101889]
MFQSRGVLAPFRALERAIAPSTLRVASYSTSILSSQRPILSAITANSTTASSSTTLPRTNTTRLLSPSTPSLLTFLTQQQVRHASHASQGTANRHSRDPAGKRLGAKRSAGEYVVPGCIIFKQRGTKWWPGENCGMGRDHTIYSEQSGYVRYYLDPERHPKRKYIGVVFEKDGKLPTPRNAVTRRKLGRVAVRFDPADLPNRQPQEQPQSADLVAEITEEGTTVGSVPAAAVDEGLQFRPGYMYREANWSIGRIAERAGVTADVHSRKNRWLAWRRRQARRDRTAQMKSLKRQKKSGRKAKN